LRAPPPPQVSHCARCKDFSVVSSDPAFGSLCWYCATFPEKPVAESAMRGRPSRYHTAQETTIKEEVSLTPHSMSSDI